MNDRNIPALQPLRLILVAILWIHVEWIHYVVPITCPYTVPLFAFDFIRRSFVRGFI